MSLTLYIRHLIIFSVCMCYVCMCVCTVYVRKKRKEVKKITNSFSHFYIIIQPRYLSQFLFTLHIFWQYEGQTNRGRTRC